MQALDVKGAVKYSFEMVVEKAQRCSLQIWLVPGSGTSLFVEYFGQCAASRKHHTQGAAEPR